MQVYITFKTPFWVSQTGEGRTVEGFIQWLAPNYAPDSNGYRWNQEAVELANLSPETRHPTLLFYIYGPQSEFITKKLMELPSQVEKDRFLFDFFHPYYSRLPHYSDASDDCKPIGCMATNWLHDELAGYGSYSNFQVGLAEGDEDIRIMRQGLPQQGLWLAGEHTAAFVALGTATGAYWSGEAVAKRISDAYDLS